MKYSNKMLCPLNRILLHNIAVTFAFYGRNNTFQTFLTYLNVDEPLMNCKIRYFRECDMVVILSKEALDVLEKFRKDLIETSESLVADYEGKMYACGLEYLKQIPQIELVEDNQLNYVGLYEDEIKERLKREGELCANITLAVLPLFGCMPRMSVRTVLVED